MLVLKHCTKVAFYGPFCLIQFGNGTRPAIKKKIKSSFCLQNPGQPFFFFFKTVPMVLNFPSFVSFWSRLVVSWQWGLQQIKINLTPRKVTALSFGNRLKHF